MRYQVPQFVDIQDKIIGPFTLKQFLMYIVAAMFLIPVYLFSDLSLFITLALPVMGVAVAFAHLKINQQTLSTVIGNALLFTTQGQMYIWRRTPEAKPIIIRDEKWQELTLLREEAQKELSSLANVARTIETQGNTVQAEEVEDPFDVGNQ